MYAFGAAVMANPFGTAEAIDLREGITDLRTNDVVEYALVLPDADFQASWFFPARATLLKSYLPSLRVLTDADVRSNTVIFERAPRHNVLYLKLPKENLYVEATEFQDRVVHSELSEFISVLARLGAQCITVRVRHRASSTASACVALAAPGLDLGACGDASTTSDGSKEWTQRFADTQVIHAETFKNKGQYFYLPKHPDWVDLITNRLQYSGLEARYTYRHANRSAASASLVAKLKGSGVECDFQHSTYDAVELEYDIVYFPLAEKTKGFFLVTLDNAFRQKDGRPCGRLIAIGGPGQFQSTLPVHRVELVQFGQEKPGHVERVGWRAKGHAMHKLCGDNQALRVRMTYGEGLNAHVAVHAAH